MIKAPPDNVSEIELLICIMGADTVALIKCWGAREGERDVSLPSLGAIRGESPLLSNYN